MDMRDRFHKAFAYLQGEQIIKGQKDLAEKLGATPGNISKALSGDRRALTNNLMKRFCEAFPGMFNLRWLILGEGNMLQAQVVAQEPMKSIEGISTKDATLESLLKQNAELIAMLKDEKELNKRLMINIANELANMNLTLRQMASGHTIQRYNVSSGDVNPAALNDDLKKI